MSSLVRRIKKRLLKKMGYTRNRWVMVNGQPVDCRKGGEITDPNDTPIGIHWPRLRDLKS